jgi:hypothetical protein
LRRGGLHCFREEELLRDCIALSIISLSREEEEAEEQQEETRRKRKKKKKKRRRTKRKYIELLGSAITDNMSVQEYLEKHKLSMRIEDAVNAAVRAKSPDPVIFIVCTLLAIYVLPVFQNFVHSNSEREFCLLATRERFAKAGEEEEEEEEEEDRVQQLHDGLLVCL